MSARVSAGPWGAAGGGRFASAGPGIRQAVESADGTKPPLERPEKVTETAQIAAAAYLRAVKWDGLSSLTPLKSSKMTAK